MDDGGAVALAILMADALSRLTINSIDAVLAVGAQGPPPYRSRIPLLFGKCS